jgi:hypothetical protein
VNPLILASIVFIPAALALVRVAGAVFAKFLKDHPSNIEISGPDGNVTVNISRTMTKDDINKKILEVIGKR